MNRSRSKSRKGPGARPKRSTRNQDSSNTDNETESVNRSQRKSKKMRVVSPCTPSTSRVSQRGKSFAQQPHKRLTETRRAVMSFFIQAAQKDPMTNGKVGSLLWIENVLDAVNKGVAKVKDRVTNLDLIWWLEKHFEIKIEDITRSFRTTRSQSRERAKILELEVQKNGRSGSRAESSDETSTDSEESVVEKSGVGRQNKVKEAIPKGAAKNLSKNVEQAQGRADNAPAEAENDPPKAVGNVQGKAVVAPEAVIALEEVSNASEAVANSQAEAKKAPESVAIAQGASSSSCVKLTAANVEASAANVRPATDEYAAAPSPEVIDLDNESNESGHEDQNAEHRSPSVALPDGSETHGAGQPVFRVLAGFPSKNPFDAVTQRARFEQERADPAVGSTQQKAVNPEVQKLKMHMVAVNLQLTLIQKDKKYSAEQLEVLTAQAKALTGMINLLTKI